MFPVSPAYWRDGCTRQHFLFGADNGRGWQADGEAEVKEVEKKVTIADPEDDDDDEEEEEITGYTSLPPFLTPIHRVE